MIFDPNNLAQYPAYDLLVGAANGLVGIDRRWVHALVNEPAKSLPDLAQFASEDRSGDRILLEQDLISIFQYLKAEEGIPFFQALIRDNPDDIIDEVVEALVQIGAPAVTPLVELYHQIEPDRAGEIAFLLAGMGIRDPRVLELLLSRLETNWEDALFHLEVYHDPAAIPELEKRAESETDAERKQDLADTVKDLKEERPEVKIAPFDIWELYPEGLSPEYEALTEEELLEFFDSPIASQRSEAATSLFGAEYTEEAGGRLLTLAETDPDVEVRACAWEAFFEKTEDPGLRKLMVDRLNDPATPAVERAGIVLGLARNADIPDVHKAILDLAKEPETRERAIEAMWRSYDSTFGPEAVKYIKDKDLEVVRNVVWAIGYLQVTKEAAQLTPLFKIEELREDALHNYALVMPGLTVRKLIPDMYEKIDELAGGLTAEEGMAVEAGLDVRLVRAGQEPYFQTQQEGEEEGETAAEPQTPAAAVKVGRNDPCPCGSGKKYKKCHGG